VLYATTLAAATAPVSISANRPSTVSARSNAADFVIVSHARFIDALAPLVSQRKSQGLETMVVDVEDVFDEYGYGSKSPDAIRDFLKSTQSRWRKAPRFAMLVGDASFDPRNYEGYGDLDLVPTRLLPTVYMKAASDDWIVDFDGDGLPNLYLGRLSVRTEAEAQTIVDKIVSYTPPTSKRVLMVVDQDDPTFSFAAAADRREGADPVRHTQSKASSSAGPSIATRSSPRSTAIRRSSTTSATARSKAGATAPRSHPTPPRSRTPARRRST
jgi:hypothetical protein